ncbi:LOB domain-containing protein 28 [Striga hermonthica]|uniref:LOB domain-containing protein 28 n=1 Tax=Striga hermonthica TaxID=68872 RepID=A0A9N7R6B1_STRHE|nr:LOB domain-containing protein 28 [Striga hermonthica]
MNNGNEYQMARATCSVCRHQRRRCEEGCVYAKYFPSERFEDFQYVHSLFGVSTAMKIINSVEEEDKDTTAETLLIEARIRAENPVHGPLGVEMRLRSQIEEETKELVRIRKQIEDLRNNEGSSRTPNEETH